MIADVRDFGAIGDGMAKDTAAIQEAIDKCASSGGGTVRVPSGRYLIGTIYLRSYIELHLEAGATLIGSADRNDYNDDDAIPECYVIRHENATGAHLIIAYNLKNVSITGQGTIDGNSGAFYDTTIANPTATYRVKTNTYPITSWRPGQMIYFCRCINVTVRDIELIDAPFTNLMFFGCTDVRVRDLLITQSPASHSDGIVIDCTQNATISGCTIRTGDDCICVFTRDQEERLGKDARRSENILVSDCILRSPCDAIRIGVSDGEIRRCLFSNIIVPEARTAVSIVSRWSDRIPHGATIEQITFDNFRVNVCIPLVVTPGDGASPPAAIRDIEFRGWSIHASAGSQLTGSPTVPLERIQLTDMNWTIHGGTADTTYSEHIPDPLEMYGYHGMFGTPALPAAIYGSYVHGLDLDRVSIQWRLPSEVWRSGIHIERASDVSFRRMRVREPHPGTGSALLCRDIDGLSVTESSAEPGTLRFLTVESSSAYEWLA